jgi:hypothetical protein
MPINACPVNPDTFELTGEPGKSKSFLINEKDSHSTLLRTDLLQRLRIRCARESGAFWRN